MQQDSTKRRRQAIREALGWLIIGIVVLWLATMAGFFSASEAESKGRPSPTPCETIAEGVERCGQTFATSAARPGDHAPRRATATPRRGK